MEQIFPYTAAARQAVLYAEKCAKETLSPVTGTEHLLLGLVMEPEGTAGVVLREAGIEEKMLRNLIRELITPEAEFAGKAKRPGRSRKSKEMTPRARFILKSAEDQASWFFSSQIGTEHILLSLMRDTDCNAAKLLHTMGVDFQAMYTKILDIIGVSDEQLQEYLQMAM